MSLTQDLQNLGTALASQLPPDVLGVLGRAAEQLAAAAPTKGSVAAGAAAPDFELPDADGKTVRLSDLLRRGPVVLSFYRGAWCPFCNLELAALQKALPAIHGLGASLVAVSPQVPDATRNTVAKHELTFPVLSDRGNRTARQYGLVFTLTEEVRPVYAALGVDLPASNGDDSHELPVAATYVIAPDGIVAHAFVDVDYTKRLDPDAVLGILQRLHETA